jgi:hypothetical protein
MRSGKEMWRKRVWMAAVLFPATIRNGLVVRIPPSCSAHQVVPQPFVLEQPIPISAFLILRDQDGRQRIEPLQLEAAHIVKKSTLERPVQHAGQQRD